ncbi:MAG TPA: dihydrolipoamide acetyltransferase family protein [Bryobacteraceae bacterium]|nr:dihydrolipoamide acetyltransferase family protein [Bryobacteraceae bacterium]HPT26419.1 dihydrolipoamide acetyltransferase family protein [Bryobacteraceae bacterium]
MAIPVEVPKFGNSVEECLIAKWLKRKGEWVSTGEIVVEIETDKATFEIPAPVDGTVLETFFEEGALVPVFTNLFVLGEAGESAAAFRPQGAAPAQAAAVAEVSASVPPVTQIADRPAASPAPAHAPTASAGALSPRARRFAAQHNFHPPAVAGSGPGGRVLEEDLRKEFYSSPRVSSLAKKRMQDCTEVAGAGSGVAGMVLSGDLVAPATRISGIREKIARRMRESLANTAQYTLTASANASGLLLLRAKVKASKGVVDININDLVTFCTIRALLEVPELNVEFIDGKICRHTEVHIGFACDTPRGLMVPVVRNAHTLTAGELSLKVKELTGQAVKGAISVDDLSGATFTLSNLGSLGIESFTPLLNPPQVAILGVNAIQLKPVRRDGRIEFIDSIGLSLTLDHQVIDGAPGARFLKVVREKIESVESLCTI